LIHGQRRIDRHEHCVTVGRRLLDHLSANNRVGADAVLNHNGLGPILAHLLADHARKDIGGSARWERHDNPDRSVGKGAGVPLNRLLCAGWEDE
jgi:hypothetical protein